MWGAVGTRVAADPGVASSVLGFTDAGYFDGSTYPLGNHQDEAVHRPHESRLHGSRSTASE